jgi:hypothetical protein
MYYFPHGAAYFSIHSLTSGAPVRYISQRTSAERLLFSSCTDDPAGCEKNRTAMNIDNCSLFIINKFKLNKLFRDALPVMQVNQLFTIFPKACQKNP